MRLTHSIESWMPTRRTLLSTTVIPSALLAILASTSPAQTTAIDGPPRPFAPAVITRDTAGRATIRAIKLSTPLRLDGVLDEAVYAREAPFDGMIQSAPSYGEPSSERSDIWITYDSENIYLSCRCWDASPPEEWVVNELRRDTDGLRNNEHIGVLFDTFYDRRSGFAFYTNPLGARADYSVVDEGDSNADWNPVWTSRPGRFDGGWTVEMAIPFKSLRYRAGNDQLWGVQIRRGIRHKNEWNYLTPVPRVMAGPRALNRVSAGGTLVGLDLPAAGKNIELKPYAVGRLTTDRLAAPPVTDVFDGELGGDIKYAVTPNLTADLTVNTDFAQVEVDEQQLNLTRFGLFFPEKREFFLEGRGTFDFARGGSSVGGGDDSDTPYLFYSRRIGLNNGAVIPINLGGRLTGKLGPYAVGLMSVGTRDDIASATEGTNFTVVRLKRDILQRSSVGVMATNRSVATSGTGSNFAYGVDGAFLLTEALTFGTYWARSATTGVDGDDQSYQARLDYGVDRYGAQAEFLSVGANFDPQVGFRRRADFERSFLALRFSPRPSNPDSRVRKYTWTMSGEYVEDGSGSVDARGFEGGFETEFASSDELAINLKHDFEFLRFPFTPSGSPAPIAVGGYTYSSGSIQYQFGAQRRASGSIRVEAGEYYDGHITSLSIGSGSFSSARISIARQLAIEPSFQISRVERSAGSFTTRLARLRVNYSFSPLMFASALVQYNSADRTFSTNVRYRWEYAPGSELFLVYTDERDMTPQSFVPPPALRGLRNRALVVKISRLLRY